jgi:hypothetical protein
METALLTEVSAAENNKSRERTMRECLDYVSGLESVDAQLLAFQVNYTQLYPPIDIPFNSETADDFDALIEFAASPDSSPSLMVRAQALEFAIDRITPKGSDASPPKGELLDRYEELSKLLSPADRLFGLGLQSRDLGSYNYVPYISKDIRRYVKLIINLADTEGIDRSIMLPDWDNHDYFEIPANDPSIALVFLSRISELKKKPEGNQENIFLKLTPLIQELGLDSEGSLLEISDESQDYLEGILRLARITSFESDYTDSEVVEAFLHRSSIREEYVKELNSIYDSAEKLKTAFPAEFALGVEKSVRGLIANSIYALRYHEYNALTDIRLPLNTQEEVLHLSLAGDEPLKLLRSLREGFNHIYESFNGQAVVRVNSGNGFYHYRFIKTNPATGTIANNVSVYIRPRGSVSYDNEMEYGRNGEGVEASINFVVEPYASPDKLLEIGKHRGKTPDDRISIRIDREGVTLSERDTPGIKRDPTQNEGTLSLDVGSILGHDQWLGTKIGRFLAFGNLLRSRHFREFSNLNHVTKYLPQAEAQADNFEAKANALIAELEGRRLRESDLMAIYSVKFALES